MVNSEQDEKDYQEYRQLLGTIVNDPVAAVEVFGSQERAMKVASLLDKLHDMTTNPMPHANAVGAG